MAKYSPIRELTLSRLREFFREPEAVFWVYGFPLLLALGLGIAFRTPPAENIFVDVEQRAGAQEVAHILEAAPGLAVSVHPAEECRNRLRLGKSSLVVIPGEVTTFVFDPTRPESLLARRRADDILQRDAGRRDVLATQDDPVTAPGSRYIDFLIPGLLGLSLMGSGMWGVGFVLVDMRVRKLLKRFLATPMRKMDFLGSLIGGRLLFMFPELAVVLGAGVLFFGIVVRGSYLAVIALALFGAACFSGLGLLVACRAQRIETVSGLMNLVQLPMWLLSGIFFSSERFPQAVQPFIQALPLTQLNNALRAVILDGASLASQGPALAILAAWSGFSFLLALRWFRWN